jgi:hypothetical protein
LNKFSEIKINVDQNVEIIIIDFQPDYHFIFNH